MKYHNITKDDMLNGDGLRVVLWVAGCEHHCKGCQNPITWNSNDGLEFGMEEYNELLCELDKKHVSGITFSGGDPLFSANNDTIFRLCKDIKEKFRNKTIWIYTGYTWEQISQDNRKMAIMEYVDVLIDGKFVAELKDATYHWAGSTNQRVIDVQKTIKKGKVILHDTE